MEIKKGNSESLKTSGEEKESSMKKKLYGKVFVVMIVLLIIYEYYVYCFEIKYKRFNYHNLNQELFIVLIFHILLFMMIWSLLVTMNTHPGEIPLYWGFYIGDEDTKRKRYCLICNAFKPERSHHCSVCNFCVLNMDHHCPWVNNCIGFYNRKFFMQLLFYLLILTIYIDFTEFEEVFRIAKEVFEYRLQYNEIYRAFIILPAYIIILVISILIMLFLKFHITLVLNNTTTIEALDPIVWVENKFRLSKMENWLQVFGENKVLWFFPVLAESGFPKGDGLVWKINDQTSEHTDENNKKNINFNRSSTPVHHTNLNANGTINNNLQTDFKSIINNLNVNIEMQRNKKNFDSNKASLDINSTKAFFSPSGQVFFGTDTKF